MYLLWDGSADEALWCLYLTLLLMGVMAMSVLNRSILILHGHEWPPYYYVQHWNGTYVHGTLWPVRLTQLVSPILHVVHSMLSLSEWYVCPWYVVELVGYIVHRWSVFSHVITATTCTYCPAPFCLDLLHQTSKQHLLYMYNQNIVGWAWASIGNTTPLSVSLKLLLLDSVCVTQALTTGLCLCQSY